MKKSIIVASSTLLITIALLFIFVTPAFSQTAISPTETIEIYDDGVTAIEEQKIVITETKEVATVTYEGTQNDLISEIASLDRQISDLQARRAELITIQTQMQTEVDKLPSRIIEEEVVKVTVE